MLDEFLAQYIEFGNPVPLNFGKGVQPNLVTDSILLKLVRTNSYITIPIESAHYSIIKKMKKPYTIISSIKFLQKAKDFGLDLKKCRTTWLLGYPNDDFKSLFRIFIMVLKYGTTPSPFPVFLFPGSYDYTKYKSIIKHKDLSELHGQLWPLVPEKKFEMYSNLLKFFKLNNLNDVKKNLHLLSYDLKKIFLEELEYSDKFINLCLKANNDNYENLEKIEREFKMKRFKKKKNIVYVIANPKKIEKAISKQLGEYFINKYKSINPDINVTIIDLYKEKGLTYINEEYVDIVFYKAKRKNISKQTKKLLYLADKYISQLKEADEIVIATPMYTLSIPSILKSYLEMIASRLYYYYKTMLPPKPVICIITRDGNYPPNGIPQLDGYRYINAMETMLKATLDFLGLTKKPKFVLCEGLSDKEKQHLSILNAKQEIDKIIMEISKR